MMGEKDSRELLATLREKARRSAESLVHLEKLLRQKEEEVEACEDKLQVNKFELRAAKKTAETCQEQIDAAVSKQREAEAVAEACRREVHARRDAIQENMVHWQGRTWPTPIPCTFH